VLSSDLPGINLATLNEILLYYRLMTKWSGLGDSMELSLVGLSQERRHPLTPHLVVLAIEVWRTRTPFLVRHHWILDWLESIKTCNWL
jgi:hypothetical protein